jgi:uncharacterized membrane protein YidH (DUF202 family)
MRRKPRKLTLGQRLAREASDYLDDLRELFASLRSAEGMVALVLIMIVLGLTVAWFVLGLGFDRLMTAASSLGVWRPRTCRDVSDIHGLALIMGGVLFFMLSAMAIGEMMLFIDRIRRGQPGRPRSVLIPAVVMLVFGIVGLTMMSLWC